jgi:hypothetical protein
MQKIIEAQQADTHKVISEPNVWWVEENGDTVAETKYLLFTNGKLLGYSLLERTGSGGRRRGRFEASEDYFDYLELFAALPQAENDYMEMNAREAYGLPDENAPEYRNKFHELWDLIEALKLSIADANGDLIETSAVRLEDLSRHYGDESERWLHVSFPT